MKYSRNTLLFWLTGLVIFASCQKSDLVGLDLGDMGNNTEIISIPVNAYTVADNPVFTSGMAQFPFGELNDPELGKTKADLIMALALPSIDFSFGTDPSLDSAVLVLKYGNEFYGDSTGNSSYSIKVHQLKEPYSVLNYPTNKEWELGTELGSKTVNRFQWGDLVRVSQIVKGGPDTLRSIEPHLRIRVDNLVTSLNLLNAQSEFASQQAFSQFIKGLGLTCSVSGNGGIAFFDLRADGQSKLEVYYKNTNSADASKRDTNVTSFNITSTNSAAAVKHDHSAKVKTQLETSGTLYPELYAQPMGGLRVRLRFPELNQLSNRNLSINKAELIIPVIDMPGNLLAPAPRFTLYRTDIAGVRQPIPDNAITSDFRALPESLFGGYYDSTNKYYKIIVTSYIQDLLNGRLKEYETYIAPFGKTLTGAVNISGSAATAARSVLAGTTNAGEKIRLNIIYTKPKSQ